MKTPICMMMLALLCVCGAAQAQTRDISILKARMSPQTFKASGLDTLSPQQLATLEAWLRAHPQAMQQGNASTASTTQEAPGSDESARTATSSMGSEQLPSNAPEATQPDHIESDIVGTFSGWSRGSIITLANGQKWRVTGDSELYVPPTDHIKATIKRAFFGSYLLTVEGYNTSARVKRIQ